MRASLQRAALSVAMLATLMIVAPARADQAASLEARFARRLPEARGVKYAAEVAPGIYRGTQPDAEGIAWLKSIGVKTVINLRHFHGDTERKRVEAAGLRYERIPLESTDAPTAEQVARFLALVRDPALRPVYVHCQHGVDRTGALMAVFRMEEQGWSNAEAFAEMQHFNAHGALRDLLNFVNGYRAHPRARPAEQKTVSPAPSSPP